MYLRRSWRLVVEEEITPQARMEAGRLPLPVAVGRPSRNYRWHGLFHMMSRHVRYVICLANLLACVAYVGVRE